MKRSGILVTLLFGQVLFLSSASAGDFDWLDSLSITAKTDSSGFRVRLATRFHIGDAEIKTVIGDMRQPSDAYMVFRLSELSRRPVAEVMTVYRANRNKGWGVMARNLGIKPGSREFHALKRGHDLGNDNGSDRGPSFNKSKGHSKSKGNKKGRK